MNLIQLPPKRWQTSQDPIYDPIRWRPWFQRLEKRKAVIPKMEAAYAIHQQNGATQKSLCAEWEISERDFRDFCEFKSGYSRVAQSAWRLPQLILDLAYVNYCKLEARHPFHAVLMVEAEGTGIRPRPMRELWDIDPTFYPSTYKSA